MLPELLQRQVMLLLDKFCQKHRSCERFQNLRLGYSIIGENVTLFEERINPAGEGWLRSPVARFVYSGDLNQWVLYSVDQHLRWRIYQSIKPSLNLTRLVKAVDEDPTGIFWD